MKIISLILAAKLIVVLLICWAYSALPTNVFNYSMTFHYPQNEPIALATAYKTWDAQHYVYLSEFSYKPDQESNRFFPLLPLLIRGMSFIIPNPLIAGLLIVNVLSAIGLYVFYLFCKEYFHKEKTALVSLIALLLFPSGFYLSLIYTEGVFLLFTICFFYFLYKNKYAWASLFAFFIPLTRPVGIFIVVPFLVYYLLDRRPDKLKKLIYLVSPVIGFSLYLLMMFWLTGNAFDGFNRHFGPLNSFKLTNIFHPDAFFHTFFISPLALHGYANSLIDRVFFICFLASLYYIYKRTDRVLFSYSMIFGLVPLFGSFSSYTRYLLLVFPLFMVLGLVFTSKKYRLLFYPYIVICLFLQVIFLCLHALNFWVA